MNNQTDQLSQLLKELKHSDAVTPCASFRMNARIRILNTVSKNTQTVPHVKSSPIFLRYAFRFAVIIIFLIAGTIVYAQSSNPGDPLFSVKVVSERTALILSPSEQIKTNIAASIIARRADEVVHAQKEGNKSEIQQTVSNYKNTVIEILKVHSISRDTVEREVIKHDQLIQEAEDNHEETSSSEHQSDQPKPVENAGHTSQNEENQKNSLNNLNITPTPTNTSETNNRLTTPDDHESRNSED
jgi:hypothetical protein